MGETVTTPDVIDMQIIEALAELRGARLDYEYSPNGDNELTVKYAERRLDSLFDRRAEANVG